MLYAIVAALVLIMDQGLKYYVTLHIALNTGAKTLIPKVLDLVYIQNTGAAFGMLSGGGARWGFVVIALAFTAGVVYCIAKGKVRSPLIRWLLVLIVAGALGNVIDRALYGYVVDMFCPVFLKGTPFGAVFNVADIFITVPGLLLCVAIFLTPSKEEPKEKQKVVLTSRKKEVSPEAAERRRQGKLYDDPAPFDRNDPFTEFEGTPAQAASAPVPERKPAAEPKAKPADQTVEQQLAGLTVDDILKELQ